MNNIFWKLRERLTSSFEIRSAIKNSREELATAKEEIFAFEMVKGYFGDKYFPLTAYVISPLVVQKLLNEISLNNCKNLLEFGSGFSSIIVCNFISKHDLDVNFTTVDNDAAYLDYVKSHLTHPDDPRFKFVAAPIEKKEAYKEADVYYSVPAMKNIIETEKKYDLVLVDGPYGKLQKNVRFGFLDIFKASFDEQTIFYIDDCHRPDEQAIVAEIEKLYGMEKWMYNNTTRLFKGERYKA